MTLPTDSRPVFKNIQTSNIFPDANSHIDICATTVSFDEANGTTTNFTSTICEYLTSSEDASFNTTTVNGEATFNEIATFNSIAFVHDIQTIDNATDFVFSKNDGATSNMTLMTVANGSGSSNTLEQRINTVDMCSQIMLRDAGSNRPELIVKLAPKSSTGEAAIIFQLDNSLSSKQVLSLQRDITTGNTRALVKGDLSATGNIIFAGQEFVCQAATLNVSVDGTTYLSQSTNGDLVCYEDGNLELQSKNLVLGEGNIFLNNNVGQKVIVSDTAKTLTIQDSAKYGVDSTHSLVFKVSGTNPLIYSGPDISGGAINLNGLVATNSASSGVTLTNAPTSGTNANIIMKATGSSANVLTISDEFVRIDSSLQVLTVDPIGAGTELHLARKSLILHTDSANTTVLDTCQNSIVLLQGKSPSANVSVPFWTSELSDSDGTLRSLFSDTTSGTGRLQWNELRSVSGAGSVKIQGLQISGSVESPFTAPVVIMPQGNDDTDLVLKNGNASYSFIVSNASGFDFSGCATLDETQLQINKIVGKTTEGTLDLAYLKLTDSGTSTVLQPTTTNTSIVISNTGGSPLISAGTTGINLAVPSGQSITIGDVSGITTNIGNANSPVNITASQLLVLGNMKVIGDISYVNITEQNLQIQDRLVQIAAVNIDNELLQEFNFAADLGSATISDAATNSNVAGLIIETVDSSDNEESVQHKRFVYGSYMSSTEEYVPNAGAWHSSHALVVGWDKVAPSHYVPTADVSWTSAGADDKSYLYVNNAIGLNRNVNGLYPVHFPHGATGIDRTQQRSFTFDIFPFDLNTGDTNGSFVYNSTDSTYGKGKGLVYAMGTNQAVRYHDWFVTQPMMESGNLTNIQMTINNLMHGAADTDFSSGGIVVRVTRMRPGHDGAPNTTSSSNNFTSIYQDVHITGVMDGATRVSGPSRLFSKNFVYSQTFPVINEPIADEHFVQAKVSGDVPVDMSDQSGAALTFEAGDVLSFGFVQFNSAVVYSGSPTLDASGIEYVEDYPSLGMKARITVQRVSEFEREGGNF